ncbi:uncharacterized protein LOC130981376 [Arachis stenosperma]|uniref:uncharacterized protein LOC130981376 n=1 Tax=Arachis stenosperma TaxID=217475 RepID=UPI0025ACF0BF|nr:uncharacterized protein LOC130981376 [Arachis stenosperma]
MSFVKVTLRNHPTDRELTSNFSSKDSIYEVLKLAHMTHSSVIGMEALILSLPVSQLPPLLPQPALPPPLVILPQPVSQPPMILPLPISQPPLTLPQPASVSTSISTTGNSASTHCLNLQCQSSSSSSLLFLSSLSVLLDLSHLSLRRTQTAKREPIAPITLELILPLSVIHLTPSPPSIARRRRRNELRSHRRYRAALFHHRAVRFHRRRACLLFPSSSSVPSSPALSLFHLSSLRSFPCPPLAQDLLCSVLGLLASRLCLMRMRKINTRKGIREIV